MQPEERLMPSAPRAALGAQALHQTGKFAGRAFVENALFGAAAKDNLLRGAEGCGFAGEASAGEFQASPAEHDFGGREHGHLAFRQCRQDPVDGGRKALKNRSFIWAASEAGGNVSAVV